MALVAQASASSIEGFSSVLESAVGKVTSAAAVATATDHARSSIGAGSATGETVIATGVPQAEKKEEGQAGNSSAVGAAKESAAAAATGNSKVAAWVVAAAAAMGVSLFMTLH